MGDNFKDATDYIAFNHYDKRSIVLVGNVAQRDRESDDLFFNAGDFQKRTFVGESDYSSTLSVD